MKTVTLSNKNFIHSQNETLLICQIKVLLIYQMKTVNFTNKIKCQTGKWLIFNLLIYKTKTVTL